MRGAEGAGRCNHAIRGMERMMARRMDCRITGSIGGDIGRDHGPGLRRRNAVAGVAGAGDGGMKMTKWTAL